MNFDRRDNINWIESDHNKSEVKESNFYRFGPLVNDDKIKQSYWRSGKSKQLKKYKMGIRCVWKMVRAEDLYL